MRKWYERMPWYWIVILISVIVGPFDALYLYNKAKQRSERKKAMETRYYVVVRMDGDYAWLRRTDAPEPEDINVARALLPEEIDEGTHLKYEMLQYEVV